MKDNLLTLLKRIPKIEDGKKFVIGIDGLSGAGKTTISKQIEEELVKQNYEVTLIHIDDYIVERNKRYNTGHEEWYEYYHLQWDVDFLERQFFIDLHNCSIITLPYYNKSTNAITDKEISIKKESIVLIEGIFLQRKEWRNYFDYIIFIDCPREIRFKRALERDTYIGDYEARIDKYKRRYWLGEDYYIKTVAPKENANLVVKN